MKANYNRVIIVCMICGLLSGCASLIVRPQKVVLLPEERIWTIPAGQEVKLHLDGKETTIIFPYDMKVVSSEVLVRQEQKLNNAALDKIKAGADRNKLLGIIGSIFAAIAGIVGIIFRKSFWPKIKGSIDIK